MPESILPSDLIGLSSGFIEHCADKNPNLLVQLRRIGKFRILGSQALHLCYVAAGKLKACINKEAKIWDDLAGKLIVRECGGSYISLADESLQLSILSYFKNSIDLFSVAELSGSGEISKLVIESKLYEKNE